MAGFTQNDLVYLLKQDQNKIDNIVACMTAIILETERRCELFQDQIWAKRMFATVMGIKKADPEIIRVNSVLLRTYIAEALTALLEHDRISDALLSNLSVQIDEIQFLRYELRHCTEALEKRLEEKIDRMDNYVTLSQEIERKKLGTDGNPFWLYRMLAEIDDRTVKDERKMELLTELLYEKKIITKAPVSAEDFVMGILNMPEKYAGAVYMELLNYSGNITADLATMAMEMWHLQTRSNRQYLEKNLLAGKILEEYGVDPKIEISLEIEYEAMVETKKIRISSALERELERKRRQQEIQANVRENAQKLQANVQKGMQGIQSNVKKHMPTVKEFFGNVKDKVKSIPAKVNAAKTDETKTDENYLPPPGTWIKAEAAAIESAAAQDSQDVPSEAAADPGVPAEAVAVPGAPAETAAAESDVVQPDAAETNQM